MTLREIVIKYMGDQYKKTKQVEFSTTEIRKWVEKNHPAYSKDATAGAVLELKKQGIITELDKLAEKTGGPGPRAKLFTLTKILEAETEPVKPKQEEIKPVSKQPETPVAEKSKPVPIPTQVAANPFDKVNSQLGELLSKVNGLANGYAVIAEAMSKGIPVADETKRDEILNLLAAVSKTVHTLHTDKLNEILEATTKPVVVGESVAEFVNARLQDPTKDDSFIYRVREEMDDRVYKTEQIMTGLIKTMPTPANLSTMSDEEKYKQGLKDGIKLAAELGIQLSD
jgi:glycerol-3-phosphate cytidylyltransferase-like family protein